MAPSPQRRSWRQRTAAQGPSKEATFAGRFFLTVLLIGLIALFVLTIRGGCGGSRHLDLVGVLDYDRWDLPPQLFLEQDFQALSQITRMPPIHPEKKLTEAGFENFVKNLREREVDTLIVHVSAHGLSVDGEPLLACSNFSLTGPGRFPLNDVLESMHQNPSKMKLLILDTQRIVQDPRLGMLVNEFPRLVAKRVAEGDKEDNLWVLLSAAPFQVPAVDFLGQRSVFNRSVEEALNGLADQRREDQDGCDGNGDLLVTLYECYYYILARCQNWYEDLQFSQTPLLLKSGYGLVTLDDPLFAEDSDRYVSYALKAIESPTREEDQAEPEQEEEEEKKVEPSPDDASDEGEGETTQSVTAPSPRTLAAIGPRRLRGTTRRVAQVEPKDDSAKSEKSQEKPDSEKTDERRDEGKKEKAAAKKAPAKKDTKKAAQVASPSGSEDLTRRRVDLLRRAWQLRDALQTRSSQKQRSPIDFAPHLWRQIEATLLDFEQRCLGSVIRHGASSSEEEKEGGSGALAVEEFEDLQLLVNGLEALETAMTEWQPARVGPRNRQRLENRLLLEWNQYRSDPASEPPSVQRGESPFVLDFHARMRRYHDLVYRAPYYVQWHGQANFMTTGAAPLPQYGAIRDLLSRLERFQTALRRLEATTTVEYGATDRLRNLDVNLDVDALENAVTSLDQAMDDWASAARKDLADRLLQAHLRDLLRTPLLSASKRMQILEDLLWHTQPSDRIFMTEPQSVDANPPDARWQRLLEQAELYQRMIRLVDIDTGARFGAAVTAFREAVGLPGTAEDKRDRLWREAQATGGVYRQWAAQLPQTAGDQPVRRWSDVAPLLVDPRDSVSDALAYPQTPFRFRPKAQMRLVLAGERLDELTLTAEDSREIEIQVEATQQELLEIPIAAQYDQEAIEVTGPIESAPVSREGGWFKKRWTFRVRALRSQDTSRRSAPVSIGTTAANLACPPVVIDCILPRPDHIDLMARRDGRPQAEPSAADTVRLHVYPRHRTIYYLGLVNRSSEVKNVSVDLYALPPMAGYARLPGRIPRAWKDEIFYRDGSLHPLVAERHLGHIDRLELPVDQDEPVPLDFQDPRKPAGKDEAKPEEPVAAKPLAPLLPQDITFGLVCLIRDASDPQKRPWVKWIEVEPLQPRQYLDARIGYDPVEREIRAFIRPLPGPDGRPDLPRDGEPVVVQWDRDEIRLAGIGDEAIRRWRGEITGADLSDAPLIRVGMIPDGKEREVALRVDGFPRAFVSQVVCKRSSAGLSFLPGLAVRRDLARLRITALQVPGRPRIYFPRPKMDWPELPKEPPTDGSTPLEPVILDKGRPAVFREAESLLVYFQCDAPAEAFLNDEDAIVVSVGGDPKGKIYGDRQLTSQLVALRPGGRWDVDLTAEDLKAEIELGETALTSFIYASLMLNDKVVAESDRIPLILDGSRPAWRGAIEFPSEVTQGENAVARARFQDRSPLARVRYKIDVEEPLGLDEQNSRLAEFSMLGTQEFQFNVVTQELNPGAYKLWVQIWDEAEWRSDLQGCSFRVVAPEDMSAAGGAAKGTVVGRIVDAANRPVNGYLFQDTVSLLRDGQVMPHKVEVKRDGTFTIADVPAGSYTIRAEGVVNNKTVQVETPVTLKFNNPERTERVTVQAR